MKKFKNFVIGGIQQKIFNLVLVFLLLTMAAYTVVILHQTNSLNVLVTETNDRQKQSIADISRQTMDAVISQSQSQSTQMEAMLADDMFKDLGAAVRMLADYAEKLFASPGDFGAREYAPPDKSADGRITVQLLTEENIDVTDPGIAGRLGLAANMSELMAALYDTAGINSCYIALADGAMLLADDHPSSKFAEDGSVITFPIRQRDWYTGAAETGGLFFTDVVSDVFTGQVGIMCGMPVYRDGKLEAVVGADLFLDNMAASVAASETGVIFTCIVNRNGHVVFSPKTEGVFRVRVAGEAADLRESENTALAAFVRSALDAFTPVQTVEADGEEWYMTGSPIPTVGWAVLNAVSVEAANQPTVMMEDRYDSLLGESSETYRKNLGYSRQTILVLLILVTVLGITGALVVAKRIVKPLNTMSERIRALGGGDLQFFMEDTYRTGDEIQVLAEGFADLSAKTLKYVDQVQKVTAEKERIGTELSMATAIQSSQLPKLFPAFPNRPEFDIYASMTPAREVGGDFYDFFLIDPDHIALVMADVSGKGVPAALFMMVARVLIKSHLQNGQSVGEALASVNSQLCEGNEMGLFVTVWAAVIEISTGKGVAANAGHEHPALCRAGGRYELVTYRHSLALAAMDGLPFKEHSFELNPGDSLFVYTDGVAEATNAENELFGTERMLEALNADPDAAPREVLVHVMDGINRFVAGAEQFDDITMLSFQYRGPEGMVQKNNLPG